MSVKFLKIVRGVRGLSVIAKNVLRLLADMSSDRGISWPSRKYLAEETGLSVRSISSALAELEDSGWLQRNERRRTDGSRQSDLLTIREPEMAARQAAAQLGLPLFAIMRPSKVQPVHHAPLAPCARHEAPNSNDPETIERLGTKEGQEGQRLTEPALHRPPVPVHQTRPSLRTVDHTRERAILLRRA